MDYNKTFLNYINTIYSSLNSEKSIASNLRNSNMQSINQKGLPTHRKGNEEWKYTNLNRMIELNYSNDNIANKIAYESINTLKIDTFSTLNISNGELIDSNILDDNIKIRNLLSNTLTKEDIAMFNSTLDGVNEDMAELNSAICKDPIIIDINNSNSEEKSKLIINIFNINNSDSYILNSPKIFINIAGKSNVEIIENHIGGINNLYTSNSVLEILLNKKSKLVHYRLLEDTDESIHINTTRIKLMDESNLQSNAFSKGTKLSRYDLKVITSAENSYSELNGLYFTSRKQHLDNYINIDHIAPHCTSRINYKGILNDESHAIFGGSVLVRKGAIKTDSLQSDKNLVLSPKAEIDSKPSLFIFVDDILAGHGATAGNIDENSVYYMRSRGLSLEQASKMLIAGFAMEIIDKVENNTLFDFLLENYVKKLPSYKFDF